MKYRRFLSTGFAVLALPVLLAACGTIRPVETVEVQPGVRAYVYADDPQAEPFAYEKFELSTLEWYDAVQVAEDRYVLSNRGRRTLRQDEIRGTDWDVN